MTASEWENRLLTQITKGEEFIGIEGQEIFQNVEDLYEISP